MPLPPRIIRKQGLSILMEEIYPHLTHPMKEHIIRINEMYRDIFAIWNKSSRQDDEVRTMLARARTMLNYILDKVYRVSSFPKQVDMIYAIGTAIGEIFYKLKDSKASIIKTYGPKLLSNYKRIFDLDYDGLRVMNNEQREISLRAIEDVPAASVSSARSSVSFEEAATAAASAAASSAGPAESSSSKSSSGKRKDKIRDAMKRDFQIYLDNPQHEGDYNILSVQTKIGLRTGFSKEQIMDIFRFYPGTISHYVVQQYVDSAYERNKAANSVPEIIELREKILLAASEEPVHERLVEIGTYAAQQCIAPFMLVEEVYVLLLNRLPKLVVKNISQVILQAWANEGLRLDHIDYTNTELANKPENRIPTKEQVLLLIPTVEKETDLEYYGKLAYRVGLSEQELVRALRVGRFRDQYRDAYDTLIEHYTDARMEDIRHIANTMLADILIGKGVTLSREVILDHIRWLQTKASDQGIILVRLHEIEKLIEEVQEERAILQTRERGNLPTSQEVSAPASLSSSSSRSRKYSSSYKRHEKFSRDNHPIHESLPPLPDKTRQQILKELKQTCRYMKDVFSQKQFDKFPKRSLQLMIELGSGPKKNCYFVRDLYEAWKEAVHSNKVFKDPSNRQPVTLEEMNKILEKIKYLRHDAIDPREFATRPSDKLEFYTIEEEINGISYHHIQLRRKVGNATYIVYDLKYIPSDLEPTDFIDENGHTTLDISSSNLIIKIRQLYDQGGLLDSNIPPYKCCKIHLSKSPQYWTGPLTVANDQYIKGVSRHRFILMINEVNSALGLANI
jgi:hypothetical protein